MTEAKTLLQMAGADLSPPPAEQAIVVAIDCQREYVDGLLPLHGVGAALEQVGAVMAWARGAGVPIIHIQHRGRGGGAFDPEGQGFQIADAAAPMAGERVIEKGLPNSFAGTELAAAIKETGRERPVIVGFMTHMCVSSTARAALDQGYMATIIAAACATRDLPDGKGGTVSAADLHAMELTALSDRFAVVLPNASALANA